MSITIGNGNKINNSNIAEKIENHVGSSLPKKESTFYEKHPIICGFLISLVAGIVLLFSIWEKIIDFLEGVF